MKLTNYFLVKKLVRRQDFSNNWSFENCAFMVYGVDTEQ
jgi:hypothetical protein